MTSHPARRADDAPITFDAARAALIAAGRDFAARGWVPATSGNFSCRTGPARMAITLSGRDKGRLGEGDIVEVAFDALPPGISAEAPLHAALYRRFPAVGAVFHTHSPAATLASLFHEQAGAVTLAGYEMLKALDGIATHEASVRLPVFANDQDVPALARRVDAALDGGPGRVGYLIAGHGLYAWGRTAADAARHVEALDFLLSLELEKERLLR